MKQVSFDSPPLAAAQLASKAKHDNHDQGTSNMTETDTEYYDKTEEEVDSLPSEEGQIRWIGTIAHRAVLPPTVCRSYQRDLLHFYREKGTGERRGSEVPPLIATLEVNSHRRLLDIMHLEYVNPPPLLLHTPTSRPQVIPPRPGSNRLSRKDKQTGWTMPNQSRSQSRSAS